MALQWKTQTPDLTTGSKQLTQNNPGRRILILSNTSTVQANFVGDHEMQVHDEALFPLPPSVTKVFLYRDWFNFITGELWGFDQFGAGNIVVTEFWLVP